MLHFRRHWDFASKHHPERESRLAFAKKPAGKSQGSTGGPERDRDETEKSESTSQSPFDNITGSTRASLDTVQALAESALNSEFVLHQAFDILERQPDVRGNRAVQEIIQKGERYMQIDDSPDDAEEARALRSELLGLITTQLSDFRTAAAFAEAFEARGDRYREIIEEQIGESDIAKLSELDANISAEAKELRFMEGLDPSGVNSEETDRKFKTYKHDIEEWDEARVDRELARLGINPVINLNRGREQMTPDQQRTLDAVIRGLPGHIQDQSGTMPSLKKKKEMLRQKLDASRKLSVMEKKDAGTETTLTDTTAIQERFAVQRLEAQKNLERTLIARATELGTHFERLRKIITEQANSSDLEAIGKRYGLSAEGVKMRINEVHLVLARTLRESKIGEREEALTNDPANLPEVTSANFMESAKLTLLKLENLSWLTEENPDALIRKFLGEQLTETKSAEAWAEENATRIVKVAALLNTHPGLKQDIITVIGNPDAPETLTECGEIAERIRDRNATDDDREAVQLHFTAEKRRKLETLLLAVESPTLLSHMIRDSKQLAADTTPNTAEQREPLKTQLREVLGELTGHRLIRESTLGKFLPIEDELGVIGADVLHKLTLAESAETSKTEQGKKEGEDALRECRLQVAKMRDALTALNAVHVVEESLGKGKSGGFRQSDSAVVIDPADIPRRAKQWNVSEDEARTRIIHHEEGHALVDALVFRTGLMPKIIGVMSVALQRQTSKGQTGEDALKEVAGSWLIDEKVKAQYLAFERAQLKLPENGRGNAADEALAELRAEGRMRDHSIDEALNRFATWDEGGRTTDGTKFAELFEVMADDKGAWRRNTPSFDTKEIAELPRPDSPEIIRHLGDDDEESAPTEGGGSANTGRMLGQEITEADNQFLLIRNFIARHKNMAGVGSFTSWVDEWETAFITGVKNPFFSDEPIDEKTLEKRMDEMQERFLSKVKEQMDAVNLADSDTVGAGGGGVRGLLGIWKSIDWISINDILKMGASVGEDLQRMWKRRGERVQSGLGQSLTSWIPKWVPYAGQLENEFRRRDQASELENVKVWKDAYDNLDPFGLQALIKGCNDKDQVRAIVELLIDKGRLDFNDTELWATLSRLSGITIPVDAMQASDITRDKWLQKMVTTIWTDTDKFFEWQQKNSSGIKSGKDKFTPTADQLSNISGGMRSALSRQLELWVENKGGSMPDDVNPHLYEELLHYAMRNGKMTMEDKLFFLVQGVRHGIMSIDRLRTLAGQTGGVLNAFPMIDYFTAGHNSLPEIEALGMRLEEASGGKARFKAGKKTTLWLHLELLRDENARARMSKATSGTRAEGLDHEDIPTIMAQADYKTVERLTDIISGSRLVMSPEGAKNAYTGFGTKFKILARLAEIGKFTQGDAMEAAKSISAYIHYDNIITRISTEKDVRNELSWSQMNQQGPSTGDYTVKEYRDPNNSFVSTLLDRLGPAVNWGNIGVDKDQYFRKPDDTSTRTKADQAKNFTAAKTLEQELTKTLADPANRNILLQTLKEFAGKLHAENGERGKDKLTDVTLKEYFKERAQHGKMK